MTNLPAPWWHNLQKPPRRRRRQKHQAGGQAGARIDWAIERGIITEHEALELARTELLLAQNEGLIT